MNVTGSRSERLEVLHVPFLPFVVQWWIVDEWEFYSAHATYMEAHAAADMLAKGTEFVRVVKRAESDSKS